jgi:virulence factor Mce-like protein
LSLNTGQSQYYRVKAHFPTVNGVIEGSDVFFGGVRVGYVSDLKVDADSHGATITLNIERKYAPMHEGATAQVRPRSLLGEKYVAATVGDAAKAAICDGCPLSDSATAVNVELDELINILDEPTRKELQQLIGNLGTGLAGQGPNTNETFQTGRANFDSLGQVTDVLVARDAELKRIIESLTKLTQTLSTDQQRATYVNLLQHSDQVLRTLKDEDAKVQQSIDRSNVFFNELDQALTPEAQNLKGIFADLPGTVTQLDALSVTLGRQANITYPATNAAASGVLEGPMIFGSMPANGTNAFTSDVFTRVGPSQGCFAVNGRTTDANGLQQNTSNQVRGPTSDAAHGGPLCTAPGFAGLNCQANVNVPNCIVGIVQSLCALGVIPPAAQPLCNTPGLIPHSASAQAAAGPQSQQQPQAQPAPAANLPQLNPNDVNGLFGFLLKP